MFLPKLQQIKEEMNSLLESHIWDPEHPAWENLRQSQANIITSILLTLENWTPNSTITTHNPLTTTLLHLSIKNIVLNLSPYKNPLSSYLQKKYPHQHYLLQNPNDNSLHLDISYLDSTISITTNLHTKISTISSTPNTNKQSA